MQIVIELSDETYKDIKEENGIYGINNGLDARITGKVVGAIQSGIPLPKGRTIDADELLKRIAEKCKIPSLSKDTVNGLCGATAIIYDMLNESGQEND